MNLNKVSVIIPLREIDLFTEEAIRSTIEALKLVEGELILVFDDQETASKIKIEEYPISKTKIKVLVNTTKGISSALNFGISNSSSELIARMDADDIMEPNRLIKQLREFQNNERLVLLGGNMDIIDQYGNYRQTSNYPLADKEIKKLLRTGCYFAHPTVMFKKSAFFQAGKYNEELRVAEDYDLWLRLSKLGEIQNLKDVLIKYRQHTSQQSITQSKMIADATKNISKQYYPLNISLKSIINEIWFPNRLKRALITFALAHPGKFRKSKKIAKIIFNPIQFTKRLSRRCKNLGIARHESAVHVICKGGAGNQLFQVAAGIELSRKLGKALFVNTDWYENTNDFKYNIGHIVQGNKYLDPWNLLQLRERKRFRIHKIFRITDNLTGTIQNHPTGSKECLELDGYWQNLNYFKGVRNELSLKLLTKMPLFPGLTIHMRGGDYVNNVEIAKVHNVLDASYYKTLLDYFDEAIPIRIVTNDIEYSKKLFSSQTNRNFEILSGDLWEDFKYLSNSKYLAIANSTFSLWAAYVGKAQSVYAPKRWYTEESGLLFNSEDIYLDDWVVL
jgi:glycosyltransferase involved in cell wall biosynthesis